jgi:NADH:ubiquinone oxidoreductase subunit 5 (subunit L)/multisubunit Na+/H+ antiporter MnhA subunit
VAFTGLAFAVSLVVLVFRLTHVVPVYENTQTFWDLQSTSASATDSRLFASDFPLLWGIRVDPLSVAFMASALFLSLLAQLHALISLRGDAGLRRFFWVAGALTFGLLGMISSPNLFQFWLGWEITGVCVWFLATHHWQRPRLGVAAARTFVVLRVTDLVLLLALVMTRAKLGVFIGQQAPPSGVQTTDPLSFTVLTPVWPIVHVGGVPGAGARTLVVLAVLFVVAATVRAALGPFHLWLSGALDAPVSGLALAALCALVPPALLLARVYPLLLEAPHLLTVLALVGAVGAVVGAVLALAQRDLFRLGMFAVASQAGLILAALGMGGYSPALFILFTGSCLCVTFFLAAGNLSRRYRSRQLADCGGAWRRMPRTTLALAGWAVGISGLSLNTYSVLSATFRNTLPTGGSVSTVTQVLVTAAVLLTMALTALYSFRVVFVVAGGDPARRRGFDSARVREEGPVLRRTALLALAGAGVATLVGIPGINAFTVGTRRLPGFTFTHFIFYGATRQVLAVDFGALAIAAVVGAGGALAAWWLFSATRSTAVTALRERFARAGGILAGPTPGERLADAAPAVFVRAGETLARVDEQLVDPLTDAMGESAATLSDWLTRLRTPRIAVSTAAAFAVIALLLAASVLAATGHFPVTVQ